MKLGKFFQCVGVVTILALGYIHLQVQIVDLAYQNNNKENQIRQLIEKNGHMTYSIATLKSANYLGIKMLAEDSDMYFANPDHIVMVSGSEEISTESQATEVQRSSMKISSLLSLLTTEAQAEVGGGYILSP
ncbi:hypothetical protein MNBD_UNCLBAC01-115 [hydrothermal vent metagenome]|uniref:Cell division protein FtsL n=1 Tax=hydrothermal vent metagenome TaxID=652676 RepID=A0A3B1D1N0_9ZZZZ